jgi:L-histidine N-alpha-methyltransferase
LNAAILKLQSPPLCGTRPLLFLQQHQENSQAICAEVIAGLQARQAQLSPKFLYDNLGSKLFEAITELPEYYPTRTEAAIILAHLQDIATSIGSGCTLIDLGAGNCEKASRLFEVLMPQQYVAVDISVEYLRMAIRRLHEQWPSIGMLGLGADFSTSLELPQAVLPSKRVFFYPGSSIGNFPPEQAGLILKQLSTQAGEAGRLLIGIDLIKDSATLQAAYDDPLQVTAAFNRNILLHVNRLLDADFALRDFKHVAVFNPVFSRIEMYLEALQDTTVAWQEAGGGARHFAQGERIHTENSYKYSLAAAQKLLNNNGFTVEQSWLDTQQLFAVLLAHVQVD